MQKLFNKTAVVTGAGSGMGKAIAELFAKEGANLILADINIEALQDVESVIQGLGGKATAVKGNIAEESDVEKMIATAVEVYGSLDILVNNAG